jgi:hypothetical protein
VENKWDLLWFFVSTAIKRSNIFVCPVFYIRDQHSRMRRVRQKSVRLNLEKTIFQHPYLTLTCKIFENVL